MLLLLYMMVVDGRDLLVVAAVIMVAVAVVAVEVA